MVCVVSFWVLRASFFLFAFLWCLVEFLRLKTVEIEYALWYKRARDLFNRRKSHPQPTACTPPSRPSSAWPRSSSRTTSHRHIKHPPIFVHNHAAPRGLGQLKNERAEGERDTLRSNHGRAAALPRIKHAPRKSREGRISRWGLAGVGPGLAPWT